MARQNKTLPARRQNATNDSLLIRSAESLGRMIGALQRQLGQLDAARQVTSRANGDAFRENGRKTTSTRAAAGGGTRVRAATSKRAAKSAAAKQTGGRKRSGARQGSRRKSGNS
jgi:hypothetical protein